MRHSILSAFLPIIAILIAVTTACLATAPAQGQVATRTIATNPPPPTPKTGAAASPVADVRSGGVALSGREQDLRVAAIAYRLAVIGRPRCPLPIPVLGMVLQHLSQFEAADRAGVVAAVSLDRGPGVIAVVADAPAARAGIQAGDVLLAIDGSAIPPESDIAALFSSVRAHSRADAVADLLDVAATQPFVLTVWRDGAALPVRVESDTGCPSRVHLARSAQRNAYADGRHVLLTTGVLALLRNDDELAFVIAHEMAHNILGHAAVMRSGAVSRGLGRTLGKSGSIVRANEREADALGGMLMIDAGYDPVAGAQMLRRLGTDLGIAVFAAHDPAGKRIDAMRALVETRGGR